MRINRHQCLEFLQQDQTMNIDIVGQAMAELPAIAAYAILFPPALEVLQSQRIHRFGIPDALHGLGAHIADHKLATPVQEAWATFLRP